jgi:hypothetical protein
MYAVATFLVVAVFTIAFGQLATGALIATGVPPDIASFQARSALSTTGFTTDEAENVVNHQMRRKILATTMFVGSLGTPTLVVTVLVGFMAPGPGSTMERSLVTVAGLAGIILILLNRPVRHRLVAVGQRYTSKRLIPAVGARATVLLELDADYEVEALQIVSDPDETVRGLRGLEQTMPGLRVLGVRRGSEYFGEPPVDVTLAAGDELIVYGRRDRLDELRGRSGAQS